MFQLPRLLKIKSSWWRSFWWIDARW